MMQYVVPPATCCMCSSSSLRIVSVFTVNLLLMRFITNTFPCLRSRVDDGRDSDDRATQRNGLRYAASCCGHVGAIDDGAARHVLQLLAAERTNRFRLHFQLRLG